MIYRILENNAKCIYTPKIELWHPEPNYQEISLEKVKNLFYTGQLTVPGPGVPPSIISGKIAATEADKK